MMQYAMEPLFLLLLLIALPFVRGPATTGACLLVILDYAYQLIPIGVFTPSRAPRYEASFYLLPFIASCMIFGQLMSDWRRRRRIKDSGRA
jgi:hypothetical protein